MDTMTLADTAVIQPNTALLDPPNTPIDTPEPDRLTKIVELKQAGKSMRQISAQLNIGVATVQYYLKKSVKQSAKQLGLIVSKDQIKSSIYDHAPKAVQRIGQLINSGSSDDVRLRASVDILNRSLGMPIQYSEAVHHINDMRPAEVTDALHNMLVSKGLIHDNDVTLAVPMSNDKTIAPITHPINAPIDVNSINALPFMPGETVCKDGGEGVK